MTLSNMSIRRFDFRTQYTAGYMVRTGHAQELFNYEITREMQNEKVSQSDKALPFIHLAYEAILYVPSRFSATRLPIYFSWPRIWLFSPGQWLQ